MEPYDMVMKHCPFARPVFGCLASLLIGVSAEAQVKPPVEPPVSLRSLEELMQVEVLTVGKKEQRLLDTAASVYVVTNDEIRRSGLTTVPDLLRLVPGVTVARIDASKWAISVRGFADRFANKLLVMIDGRSLYSRMFSGVFWDALGVPVEEIERIEVIRGPGASLWGANAVNGVINIVTRAASRDPGTTLTVGSGIGDHWTAGAAHSRSTRAGALRVFGYASERGSGEFDQWRDATGGARFQRGQTGRTHVTLDANAARSDAGQRSVIFRSFQAPFVVSEDVRAVTTSWSTVGRWTRPTHKGSEWQIIGTHEGMRRHEPGLFQYARRNSDVNVQHRLAGVARNDVIWGSGVRVLHDEASSEGPTLTPLLPEFAETLFNAFVQDEITVASGFKITLGTKVEHTAITGWNVQPNVRAWWSPDGTTAMWAAVSRALRTPSWTDTSVRFNAGADATLGPLPFLFGFVGNPDVQDEELTAYEAGLRTTIADRVAVDVSGYYNRYADLIVRQLMEPVLEMSAFGPHLFFAQAPQNILDATTAGFEAVAMATLTPTWHLTGTVEVFRMTDWKSSVADVDTSPIDGTSPGFQWSLRSSYSQHGFEYDTTIFKIAALRTPPIPAYTRVDARVSRHLKGGLELTVAGQNLLQSHHPEAAVTYLLAATQVTRTVSLRATWRFGK
jgi:iron complex outermembrane receptor protein